MEKFIAVVSGIIIMFCVFCKQQKPKHISYNNRISYYGNGVYHFPADSFGYKLSEFISTNDSLRLQSVAGDGASMGAHIGYFVIFEKK